MAVHPKPQRLQLFLIRDRGGLLGETGQHHGSHAEPLACKCIDQAQHIRVICDAVVAPDFIFLNVGGIDDDYDLRLIPQLLQHGDFGIGMEARKHAGRVIVVKELPAEFQIQLSAKLADPFTDMFGLHFQIQIIIKACSFHLFSSHSFIRANAFHSSSFAPFSLAQRHSLSGQMHLFLFAPFSFAQRHSLSEHL